MKRLALLLLASAFLSGCATPPPPDDRYLTKEQDAAMREQCAATGCAIVPVPVWQEILRILKEKGV